MLLMISWTEVLGKATFREGQTLMPVALRMGRLAGITDEVSPEKGFFFCICRTSCTFVDYG